MAFNEKEYTDWLRSKGLQNAKTDADRKAARDAYVKEVLLPQAVGQDGRIDVEVLNQSINDFAKARPLDNATTIDINSVVEAYNPTIVDEANAVPSAPLIGGSPSSDTSVGGTEGGGNAMDVYKKRFTDKQSKADLAEIAKANKVQNIEGGVNLASGLLKAGAGVGQYFSGKKQMKGLKMPKDVAYEPLKALDTEIAKAQGLAETGDAPLIELGRREIANEKALADNVARMASSGDISAYGAGAQANSINAMNAYRKLLADTQLQKRADRQMLQGLLGQKAQQEQFKAGVDDANRDVAVAEYTRKGIRAADILGAGVDNIATGIGDIKGAGLAFAKRPDIQSQVENFDVLDEQMQSDLAQKYPSIFGDMYKAKLAKKGLTIPSAVTSPTVMPSNFSIA